MMNDFDIEGPSSTAAEDFPWVQRYLVTFLEANPPAISAPATAVRVQENGSPLVQI